MLPISLRSTGLCLALCAALSLSAAHKAHAQQQYAIDYLITPYKPGIYDSWLFGINNQGQATGYVVYQNAGGHYVQSIARYTNGELQTLDAGSQRGLLTYTGVAINSRGDIAGLAGQNLTFISASGTETQIVAPNFFLNGLTNGITGINNSGTVLLEGSSGDAPSGQGSDGFGLWSASGFQPLSALYSLYPYNPDFDTNDGLPFTYTQGITNLNEKNQFAAGIRQVTQDPNDPNNSTDQFQDAFIYNGADGYNLLADPSGDAINPINIDQNGEVFGWVGSHLALWNSDGSLNSLLPDFSGGLKLGGGYGTPSIQRNDNGDIVAITSNGGVANYDSTTGDWTDISSSILGLDGAVVDSIQGYNDEGQFVGLVRPPSPYDYGVFGYVVSTVPEPGSLALLLGVGVSGGLLALRRSRRRE